LCSKPGFTSPQPLAAASGLTIPLQITLSEIKLSAFIIVVFSKQKGLTLVFRNDPLESLKVSSTFDSIQFVRDYLQKTIEVKLRDLMMDELPAIIHRLSLRLWCPDQVPKDEDEHTKEDEKETALNPLSSPPLDPIDSNGHRLDSNEISSWSLDGSPEIQSLFSQKNLLRVTSLTNNHLTSSLVNPLMQEAIFRAWAGPSDRFDATNTPPVSTPSLARSSSYMGSNHTYTFSDSDSQYNGLPSRSSMVNLTQATTGLSLGSGRHAKAGRKKKTRVVNLRRKKINEDSSETGESVSETASTQSCVSEPFQPIQEEPEEELVMPTISTANKVRFRASAEQSQQTPRPSVEIDAGKAAEVPMAATQSVEITTSSSVPARFAETVQSVHVSEKRDQVSRDEKASRRRGPQSDTSSVIMEQAWIMKMAGEIARRVYEEKNRNPAFWEERDAPPAYEAS